VAFHDSTLEFIAVRFSTSLRKGAVLTALMEAAGEGA
jgi:hypothetical protein